MDVGDYVELKYQRGVVWQVVESHDGRRTHNIRIVGATDQKTEQDARDFLRLDATSKQVVIHEAVLVPANEMLVLAFMAAG